ncbi:MAG: hypothetical protein COB04_03445 [Gammaproteobacteria bacterium]|nr:MAG: hypothetical protein COB04_03445 [Gammaproteobacteria bacterium]
MKDEVVTHEPEHYLDAEHSTSLRKLLALMLLSGVVQVGLISFLPLQVYMSFVLATLFILYGINIIYRTFKVLARSTAPEDDPNHFTGTHEVRHITARDWRRGQLRRKIRHKKKTTEKKSDGESPNAEKSANNIVTFKRPP